MQTIIPSLTVGNPVGVVIYRYATVGILASWVGVIWWTGVGWLCLCCEGVLELL